MRSDQKSLRLGAAVIVGVIGLRILSGSLPDGIWPVSQKAAAAIVYAASGRIPQETAPSVPPVTQVIHRPTQPQIPAPVFTAADGALVRLNNVSGKTVDIPALLEAPLDWDLAGTAPTVLILHTHTCESYTNTQNYKEQTAYRTQDEAFNMLSIGDAVAEILEAAGIRVIHDRTVHDQESYNGSYDLARQTLNAQLTENPGILLVLDLHRDAMEDKNGNQIGTTVATAQGNTAQLMPVIGTGNAYQSQPHWEENLALAVKLQAALEAATPGICRPIALRSQRYNQDLSPGTLLIEVGAAGNTHDQAILAAQKLAEAIVTLKNGANRS